jgi:RimJ/RimL family protein N-acetyltransferase
MLAFTTAADASMDAFMAVSAGSPYQPQLEEYAQSLLQQRFTKPEWCVLGTVDGRPLGRAALWSLADQPVPSDVVLIEADWYDPELTVGREVLAAVHELAGGLGSHALSHHVDSPPGPPQYQEHEESRIRLLTLAGYEPLRDGLRWRYAGPSSPAPRESSLRFRTVEDVGEEAFVEAIAATYEGTRDSWISQSIEELGALEAARTDFHELQGLEHEPAWWELGYTQDGALAGVVMGAKNPSSAVVAYIGVVPAERGRGFAPELVRRGTERLLASGQAEIRGDCDRDNVGMVKAFERAGFEQFARRRSYRLML